MATYVELVVEDAASNVRKGLDDRNRAGVRNVRRPMRGIEMKEDTYAVFRVYAADGKEIKLVDSSWPEGEGRGYANFLLQSVQEARMEKQQILETFSSALVFFFGEAPRFVDVSAVLLNTHDFDWEAEWWRNYDVTLRGTRLVEQGARALLCFDDTVIEGYPMNASAVKQAGEPNMVQLSFRMFVTNAANVSNVGDPNFPIHAEATIPQALNQRDDRTFAFELESPQEANRRALGEYLKRLAGAQIAQEIASARTIEEARTLQRQYALEQLGVVTEGANLLALGKSFFQGVVAGQRGDGETLEQAKQRFQQEAKKALQLSRQGRTVELQEFLSSIKPTLTTGPAAARANPGNTVSLVEALRQSLIHSANYPQQDFAAFAQRVQEAVFPNGTRQLLEPKRTLPWRSKIVDNVDEYTGLSRLQLDEVFEQRTGVPVNGDVPDLPAAVEERMSSMGLTPTADNLYQAGVITWAPGKGLQVGGSPNEVNPLGRPLAPNTGADYRYTYSKSWGSTPGVGGSYGGGLGGGIGKGIGGRAQDPSELYGSTGFRPQGSQYGGSTAALPPNSLFLKTGADGRPLLDPQYQYGPTPGGTFLGGGAATEYIKELDLGALGHGVFSLQVIPGDLT